MIISSVFVLRRRRGEMQKIVRWYMELMKIEEKKLYVFIFVIMFLGSWFLLKLTQN